MQCHRVRCRHHSGRHLASVDKGPLSLQANLDATARTPMPVSLQLCAHGPKCRAHGSFWFVCSNKCRPPPQPSAKRIPATEQAESPRSTSLLQRDEARRVGGANARLAVLDRLVGDGVLCQVATDHVRLDLDLHVTTTMINDRQWSREHMRTDGCRGQRSLSAWSICHDTHKQLGGQGV